MEEKRCTTLQEARDNIDSVDEEIIKLIAKRNNYIKEIAHFKTTVEEVKAQDRIDEVIAKARALAITLELSPNLVNELYLTMINGMVESEIAEFKNANRF